MVGGHISEHAGEPALSAFAVGSADRVLSATRARPGQALVLACCLDGRMRTDFAFFTTLGPQGPRLAADVRLLAEAARTGLASAAKDVSMAGVIGSLAMLLEPAPRRRCRPGRPADSGRSGSGPLAGLLPDVRLLAGHGPARGVRGPVPLRRPRRAVAGTLTGTGVLSLHRGADSRAVIDLNQEPVTGLWD